MAHATIGRLLLATLATIVCAGAAQAQTPAKPVPDISGRWQFKTDVIPNKSCVISGEIEFRKAIRPVDYVCTFKSREDCDGRPEPTFTEVKQSCVARVINGEIDIASKVEAITDGGPAWFKQQMQATMNYAPDNFRVHPQDSMLVGMFHSINQTAVRFWRGGDLVS